MEAEIKTDDDKKPFRKATRLEIVSRIEIIASFLLKGTSRHDIVQYCSEKWGISTRHGDTYIKRAYKKISIHYSRNPTNTHEWHMEARRDLLANAIKIQDLSTARWALGDMAKLGGRYPDKKIEIDVNLPRRLVIGRFTEKIDGESDPE